jgi:hypothetical protein
MPLPNKPSPKRYPRKKTLADEQSSQARKIKTNESTAKYEYSKGENAKVNNTPAIGESNSHRHFDKKFIIFVGRRN